MSPSGISSRSPTSIAHWQDIRINKRYKRGCVAPYVRSVGHVFAYLYTLDDYSERPMDYETSLLPNVFPLDVVKLEDTIIFGCQKHGEISDIFNLHFAYIQILQI